jgi:hypothetical protein
MASFFVTRNDAPRTRAVSNGGLGGFVTIGSIRVMETSQGDGKATWPKNRRRKNRPPPISIIEGIDKYFIKQEVMSPTPIAEDKCSPSPRTPISRYNALLTPSKVSGHATADSQATTSSFRPRTSWIVTITKSRLSSKRSSLYAGQITALSLQK